MKMMKYTYSVNNLSMCGLPIDCNSNGRVAVFAVFPLLDTVRNLPGLPLEIYIPGYSTPRPTANQRLTPHHCPLREETTHEI